MSESHSYHILYSFGAVAEIFMFLEPLESLFFQGINRWMYHKGVSRAQRSLYRANPYAFFSWPCTQQLGSSLFVYNKITEAPFELQDSKLDFYLTQSVQVGAYLFTISWNELAVTRYRISIKDSNEKVHHAAQNIIKTNLAMKGFIRRWFAIAAGPVLGSTKKDEKMIYVTGGEACG